MDPLNIPGKITITRVFGGDEQDLPVSITVCDALSGKEFLEVRISFAGLSEALLGMGRVDCHLEYRPSEDMGKRREHKLETVWFPDHIRWGGRNEDLVKRFLEPFEVDGWKGNPKDAFNQHRLGSKDEENKRWSATIGFIRYLSVDETENS